MKATKLPPHAKLNPVFLPALFLLGAALQCREKLLHAGGEGGRAMPLPSTPPKDATTSPAAYAAWRMAGRR